MPSQKAPVGVMQERVRELRAQGWSIRKIGVELGICQSTVSGHVGRLEKAGKLENQSPKLETPTQAVHAAPEGYLVKGTSTLFGGDGETKLQWVKTAIDEDRFKAMVQAACRAAAEDVKPLPTIDAPSETLAELLNLYTITDAHIGMMAWARESGEDWDLKIAERCLIETFSQMIDAAPAAKFCIVDQKGDFLHFDSFRPTTPEHGNILDADSRYQKIVEVAVRIARTIVNKALEKHKTVLVLMEEGNHDPVGSVWLRVLFAALYEKNPRCTVDQSPLPYVAHQHGKTMLCFTHGHLLKNTSLPLLFAARFPQMWGETKKRYIHVGHRHHVEEKEHPGVKVIQHPTLAAADAYAARGGWLSERQATSMTYHVDRGEVARGIFLPA